MQFRRVAKRGRMGGGNVSQESHSSFLLHPKVVNLIFPVYLISAIYSKIVELNKPKMSCYT